MKDKSNVVEAECGASQCSIYRDTPVAMKYLVSFASLLWNALLATPSVIIRNAYFNTITFCIFICNVFQKPSALMEVVWYQTIPAFASLDLQVQRAMKVTFGNR